MPKRINQKGAIFALALIALTAVLVITIALVSRSFTYKQSSRYSMDSLEASTLAEAGIDKAVAALNKSGGSYDGEAETSLGAGAFSVDITNLDASTKKIQATGYVPDKTNPKSTKTIELQISKGVGVAFNYGVQVGQGGLQMSNSARVNGSVHSLGNISMSGSSTITGDAYVAGAVQPTADQQSDCVEPNCADYTFGQNSGGVLDVAQSFQPSTTSVINKIALKIKKVGSPPNVTVRILGNSGGNPDKNSVLASGTLSASLVTNQYGFVEIAFPTPPTLSANTTYWIMVDTSLSATNYWRWSSDSTQGYNRGSAKWSANWQAGSPVWNAISPAGDLGFKTFMGGGTPTSITGSNNARINGNAHANTITGMTIDKDAYYQLESSNIVSGQNCSSNSHCHPGSEDPGSVAMPISQANIDDWKQQAEAAGSLPAPDCNTQTVWGPGKYTGNVNLSNNCKEIIKAPIWITGNFNMTNSTEMKLDPSFGAASGALIVDNFITLSNSNKLLGSGTEGSYLIAVSEFNSKDDPSHRVAINISNSGNQGIVYANLGIIQISNSNTMTEITGWQLNLTNSVTINYDQGLAGAFFSSGPSGAYSIIKGTYQLK